MLREVAAGLVLLLIVVTVSTAPMHGKNFELVFSSEKPIKFFNEITQDADHSNSDDFSTSTTIGQHMKFST